MLFVAVFVFYVVGVTTTAWGFMLAVGVAHAQWLTSMPTVGYGTSLTIWLVFTLFPTIYSIVVSLLKAAAE
jgi:hypothetical protein